MNQNPRAQREEDFGARLSFDRGAEGRRAVDVPRFEGTETALPDAHLLRDSLLLPEWGQLELVRYYTALSERNYGIDSGTYPLGSCTMKYNPKVNELIAAMPGFVEAHPLAPLADVQGTLECLFELQNALGEITGMAGVSLAPAAGAHGEFAGILMVKRALEARGELQKRRRILVPDSAHGTNPATATMAGFTVTQIPSAPDGSMDHDVLARELDDTVAALMVTEPNTLGLWERDIDAVAAQVHAAGAYVYGDGANLNAILGQVRFGDLGFDVVHLNLHKSFSTPHGGGGPGAGPVCCTAELMSYLPAPIVQRAPNADDTAAYELVRPVQTIGQMQQFHGNVGVLLRAYSYIRALGLDGLREISTNAALNANYLWALVRDHYDLPYGGPVLHEVVFSGSRQKREHDIRTYDIAKRLIDYGFHPPTVYFPLIVDEALMIEPTESETRESVEALAAALVAIAEEAARGDEALHEAPVTAPIGRLDETNAARHPILRWQSGT